MTLRHIQHNSTDPIQLRHAVMLASEQMLLSYNLGHSKRCGEFFEPQAVLHCNRQGMFIGRDAICGFWQSLKDEGGKSLRYSQPSIDVINGDTAVLSGYWFSEVSRGEILKEVWTWQPNGQVKIIESEFNTFYA